MHMRRAFLFETMTKAVLVVSCIGILGYAGFAARGYVRGPSITITEPTHNSVTKDGALTISGNATNFETITLNGRVIFTSPDGVFSERMLLTPGTNTFVIEATDTFGTRHEKQITVAFAPHRAGEIETDTPLVLVLLK